MSERRSGARVPVLVAGVLGAEIGDCVAGLGLGGELAEPGGEGRVGVGPTRGRAGTGERVAKASVLA